MNDSANSERFPSFRDWLAVDESNARKRAVKAALNGTGPSLPGSYAACPSTNPTAMKVAAKKGIVTNEAKELRPDYSFDRWMKMAQDLGSDTTSLIDRARKTGEDLERRKGRSDDGKFKGKDDEPEDDGPITWEKLQKRKRDTKAAERKAAKEEKPEAKTEPKADAKEPEAK